MNSGRHAPLLLAASLATFTWSLGASAIPIVIDDFNTNVAVINNSVAPNTVSGFTGDSGIGMVGDRTIDLDVLTGGGTNTASAIVESGLLSLSNSVTTNSFVTVSWDFLSLDLTDGGSNTGLFFNLPAPIDNDLTIGFALNGGATATQFFPDGSTGTNFFIDFDDFVNGADADDATSLEVSFSSDDPAWDAGFNFIEANTDVPVPATFSLIALGLLGIGVSRRKRAG